jgi:hypothetical protein
VTVDDLGGLSFLAEINQLRVQALDLFDRCLAEGNPAPIIIFIERQLVGDPPHLQLLRDFAEDLQQRLISLRTYHYDVRENVVRTFADAYRVDITPLAPANDLPSYHKLDPQKVVAFAQSHGAALTEKDRLLLAKMVEVSVKAADHLAQDIKLTEDLHRLVLDWLEALSRTIGRRYWSIQSPMPPTIQ